jgi:Uma2 family endonuclease
MAMPVQLPRYTVDQVKAFPRDGMRYELLDGVLLVTPGAGNLHQIVAGSLFAQLYQALVVTGLAWATAPGEVEVGDRLLLDPDVLVYPRCFAPGTHWKQIREWWLAVEIESRSTRVYDREYKRNAYLELGVQEVWLVSPRTRTLQSWTSAGRQVCSSGVFEWRPRALGGLAVDIDLDRVFPSRE